MYNLNQMEQPNMPVPDWRCQNETSKILISGNCFNYDTEIGKRIWKTKVVFEKLSKLLRNDNYLSRKKKKRVLNT